MQPSQTGIQQHLRCSRISQTSMWSWQMWQVCIQKTRTFLSWELEWGRVFRASQMTLGKSQPNCFLGRHGQHREAVRRLSLRPCGCIAYIYTEYKGSLDTPITWRHLHWRHLSLGVWIWSWTRPSSWTALMMASCLSNSAFLREANEQSSAVNTRGTGTKQQ